MLERGSHDEQMLTLVTPCVPNPAAGLLVLEAKTKKKKKVSLVSECCEHGDFFFFSISLSTAEACVTERKVCASGFLVSSPVRAAGGRA